MPEGGDASRIRRMSADLPPGGAKRPESTVRFVRTMRKVGYTGHVGVEILNAEIREWTLERAAKAAFDTSAPVMS